MSKQLPGPHPRLLLVLFAIVLLGLRAAADSAPAGEAPWAGRWTGSLVVPRPGQAEQTEALSLRLLPEGFVLVDFPDRRIYGFPVRAGRLSSETVLFDLGGGAGALHFEGRLSVDRGPVLSGRVVQGGVEGSWSLAKEGPGSGSGEAWELARKGGYLRGSLLVPAASGPRPLVVLVAGSGQTDRDGNNYQVPGRNDSLLLLARALAAEGVASLRYDRRGVGESIGLAAEESTLRFEDEVADLGAVLDAAARDGRFSSIVVAGHSDGALAAADLLAARDYVPPGKYRGLAVLASGSTSALETFRKAIEGAPATERGEGEAILAALLAGGSWPKPSSYYADFFRPSFQPYLRGWLRASLKELLPAVKGSLLLVQGDRDMQVELQDFLGLAAARPEARALVLPGMNHVLKRVPAEVEANFASFSDPSYPVDPDLVASLAAFARGEPSPAGLPRVDGGRPGSGGTAGAEPSPSSTP